MRYRPTNRPTDGPTEWRIESQLKEVGHVPCQVGNLTQSGMILRQLGLGNEWVIKLVRTYCHLRDKET